MELKFGTLSTGTMNASFNRTFMELKYWFSKYSSIFVILF